MSVNFEVATESPALDAAIVDPQHWADERWLHEQFAWLRNRAPIRRMAPDGVDPFWSIARHADILAIEGNKRLFLNDPRPILAPKLLESVIQHLSGRRHLVRSLVQMDDPDHRRYRAVTQQWFMGSNLRKLERRITELAAQYVDRLGELGGECDFVKDIATLYPLRVIMTILGVSEEDEPLMRKLTQELFGSADPDTQRTFDAVSLMDVVGEFDAYFRALTRSRRAKPTDDLASVIANARIAGEPLPEHETNGYYIIIATAGHDTTSSATAGGLLALTENPAELDKLRANPSARLASAVDEMFRWVSPVRHFVRTASADCTVGGVDIAAGESCALWYPSANRDEAVFDAPFSFRVDRPEVRHLAFGYGAHVCLGQHLARMEMTAFFKELLRRVEHLELAGQPRYSQSLFVGGLKSLPIRYRMR